MKIREVNQKAENIIEQGENAKQRQIHYQQAANSARSQLMAAYARLEAASETDEDGEPVGDVAGAQAEIYAAQAFLASAESGLMEATQQLDGINQQKLDAVQEIERYESVEEHNLSILAQLQKKQFGTNAAAFMADLAAKMNSSEQMRQQLLQSMGMSSAGKSYSAGSAMAGGGVSGSSTYTEQPQNAGQNQLGNQATTDPNQTAYQKLAAYMSSHNYGIDDYDVYSKDPEWQKLHAAVFPDFHQIANHQMSHDEKVAWVDSVVNTGSRQETEGIINSMEHYSVNGYDSIHWDKNCELQETKDILRVFDSGKVRPYKGVIHRGLSFDSKKDLFKALKRTQKHGGKWDEPSITSFSASQDVAEKFASMRSWGLVLTCSNNKSAIPFRHMSVLSWEDEVLSPGNHRNQGWTMDMNSIRVDEDKKIVYADIKEI